jgi:hypothetical protein
VAETARAEFASGKTWSPSECDAYEKEAAVLMSGIQEKLVQLGANDAYSRAVKVCGRRKLKVVQATGVKYSVGIGTITTLIVLLRAPEGEWCR